MVLYQIETLLRCILKDNITHVKYSCVSQAGLINIISILIFFYDENPFPINIYIFVSNILKIFTVFAKKSFTLFFHEQNYEMQASKNGIKNSYFIIYLNLHISKNV